jgi:hypothetical protein
MRKISGVLSEKYAGDALALFKRGSEVLSRSALPASSKEGAGNSFRIKILTLIYPGSMQAHFIAATAKGPKGN